MNRPQYELSLDGNILTVMSDKDSDIGSHLLRMNAHDSSASGNFAVNITFSKEVAASAEIAEQKYSYSQRDIVLSVIESDHLLKNTSHCNT